MDFGFPFPSLMQLTLLRIGEHLLNKRIGPFRRIFNSPMGEPDPDGVERIVELLPIPRSLKPATYQVITGVYFQTRNWVRATKLYAIRCRIPLLRDIVLVNYKEMEFLFDVNGKLNELNIWSKYFNRNIAQAEDISSLIVLLQRAFHYSLVPQIGAILKKILFLAGEERETHLEGPRHKIIEGEDVLVYSFMRELPIETAGRLITGFKSFHSCFGLITLTEEGIVATLTSQQCHSFQLFKQHFNLLNPLERESYARRVVYSASEKANSGLLVDVLGFLNNEGQRHCLLKCSPSAYYVLECFLDWPFVRFFIPTLNLMHSNLEAIDYRNLFVDIIWRIPKQVHWDVFYGNLLLNYWHIVHEGVKRKFRIFSTGNDFRDAIEMLASKNASLHCTIAGDISAMNLNF